ncbi:unnamed protein product [Schistosoma mattheei]|uniref:Uncharacterized protein n=1 Tax=Schistosoma mattheei TaxID=31246 RepID=A0A183Q2H8_9TREM|nr:unnamed protein product [Schistosoma mattheei]
MLHERTVLCHQLEEMSIEKDKSEYKCLSHLKQAIWRFKQLSVTPLNDGDPTLQIIKSREIGPLNFGSPV